MENEKFRAIGLTLEDEKQKRIARYLPTDYKFWHFFGDFNNLKDYDKFFNDRLRLINRDAEIMFFAGSIRNALQKTHFPDIFDKYMEYADKLWEFVTKYGRINILKDVANFPAPKNQEMLEKFSKIMTEIHEEKEEEEKMEEVKNAEVVVEAPKTNSTAKFEAIKKVIENCDKAMLDFSAALEDKGITKEDKRGTNKAYSDVMSVFEVYNLKNTINMIRSLIE